MTTVLITGARAPVAQDLARACRAAGATVHLADSVTPWAARAMRPRVSVHRLPPPRTDFPAFRERMRGLLADTGADLIIPTCEEVFWLAEAAARDGYAARLFAPSPERLAQLHSKASFPAFAASLGLDAPDTWLLADRDALAETPLAPGELVLKPEYSRFGREVLIAPDAAARASVVPTERRRWVAQRRIDGDEICAWSAVREGRIVAFAAYRPRWRHGRGAAYQFEAVDIPAVRRVAETIAAGAGMTGHLSFDIIVDGVGRAWPVECNPRAVSGLHLLDSDAALGRALMGDVECPPPPPGRLRHLAPAMLILGVPAALGSGRLADLRSDWCAGRDVISRPGDRLPWLGCAMDAARFAAVGALGGRSASAGATADIEWDGEPIP